MRYFKVYENQFLKQNILIEIDHEVNFLQIFKKVNQNLTQWRKKIMILSLNLNDADVLMNFIEIYRYCMQCFLIDILDNNSAHLLQIAPILNFKFGHKRHGQRFANTNVYY